MEGYEWENIILFQWNVSKKQYIKIKLKYAYNKIKIT
jgi:hypothetical protein